MSRINLLLIDKDMNTLELDIPTFMLKDLNYDNAQVVHHETKKSLTEELNNFLKKHSQ